MGEQETIEKLISRIIFAETQYDFSDILRLMKFTKGNDFLFILIDGINEHKDLHLFSLALEQFIHRCREFNIKIILTCRSEYFDDRFGNLLHIENHSLLDMDAWEFIHKIPDVHQNALITKYFSEFNITISLDKVAPKIIEAFNSDKLLLRIYCEAYEDEQPPDVLDDLFKLEIFNKYFEKKFTAIPGLDNCLSEIINWMVEHEEFTNIRIVNLSRETTEVVEATAYENVVIKRDLIIIPGVAFGRTEVINFVYDEFRDFLIASRKLIIWDNDNPFSREQIHRFTNTRFAISEGLQKYLCLWAIKNDRRDLLEHLSSFSWFNSVFIDSVFDSPDSSLSEFVIGMIQDLFASDASNALKIIGSLLHRTKGQYTESCVN